MYLDLDFKVPLLLIFDQLNDHACCLSMYVQKCQSEGSEFSDEKSPSVAVVCPGDELPKWLSYQTEGCSIKVKLPLTWCHDANFLGLALCAVVTTHNPCWLDYGFNFVFKTINGESHQFNHCARTYERARTGWGGNISDHLFVWYDSLEEVWSTDFNNAIEASFEFFAQNKRHVGGVRSAVGYCSVQRCGISLLSTDYCPNAEASGSEISVISHEMMLQKLKL